MERRSRLLDPAEAEFAVRGFDGASLNRIPSNASMSKGQACYYIDDKADLYGASSSAPPARFLALPDFRHAVPGNAEDFWRLVGELFSRVTAVFVADE